MAITSAQTPVANSTSTFSSATSLAKAYTSNVTAGNLLVVAISAGPSSGNSYAIATPPTVADTLGNTWTMVKAIAGAGSTSQPGGQFIYATLGGCKSTGANTVTVSVPSASNFIAFTAYEFHTSVAGTWTVDQSGGATSASTVSLTAAQAPSVAIASTSNWSGQPTAAGTGWNFTANSAGIFTGTAYDLLAATGAFAPAFTVNVTTSDASVASVNIYVAASGALALSAASSLAPIAGRTIAVSTKKSIAVARKSLVALPGTIRTLIVR